MSLTHPRQPKRIEATPPWKDKRLQSTIRTSRHRGDHDDRDDSSRRSRSRGDRRRRRTADRNEANRDRYDQRDRPAPSQAPPRRQFNAFSELDDHEMLYEEGKREGYWLINPRSGLSEWFDN